jgi:anthranilate synthase component 1
MVIDPPGPNGKRRASVQAGAGVVADSIAAEEELETRNKAKALLSAIGPAEQMTRHRRASAESRLGNTDSIDET